jgi:hypothetical protein
MAERRGGKRPGAGRPPGHPSGRGRELRVWLPEPYVEWAQREAARRGVSVSAMFRDWMEKREPRLKRAHTTERPRDGNDI